MKVTCLTILFAAAIFFGSPQAHGQDARWSDGSAVERPAGLTLAADWDGLPGRRWAGPSIWCNRLQDWHTSNGALVSKADPRLPCRTAHLLTYELADRTEPFRLAVALQSAGESASGDFTGFLLGAGEGKLDYRGAAMVHHFPGKGGGILAVRDAGGGLVFRDMSAETNAARYPLLEDQRTVVRDSSASHDDSTLLYVEGVPAGAGNYDLRLSAWDENGSTLKGAAELRGVPSARLRGNIALASHRGNDAAADSFRSFQVGGGRLVHRPERTFGPIAGTLYTVANQTLKLSAQFTHLGSRRSIPKPGAQRPAQDSEMRLTAALELRTAAGRWERVDGPKTIAAPDFNVQFRVDNWDASRDAETRVVFRDVNGRQYDYETRIKADPTDKDTISAAGFTGMGVVGRTANMAGPEPGPGEVVVGRWSKANLWMPFAESVEAVQKQGVDILFFTGDQIYEGKPSPTDVSFEPEEDYLYKWLLWHWSFRELTNHLPASVQPDDHDVYHGNLWGWGGRLNRTGHNAGGGYLCSPYFVNMVHKTQSGHLPDPYDPLPIRNGITNYYTNFTWGGVGFAVLEDRKFKSPAHVEDPAEQTLLGETQERMLREWGEDWAGQAVKCVVSQTIYAGMHVSFDGRISQDRDTNSFPKPRRDTAVRLFRRCGAFILSGDQHLSTFGRLGVEEPSDAVYQFAVPAMGNIFWRWFYPRTPGSGRRPGDPDYTGEFLDGNGNYFRMIAVANPERRTLLEQQLRQRYLLPADEARNGLGDEVRTSRGDGYGIVRFNKRARTVTVECWPYDAHVGNGGKPFDGWPVTLSFDELDGRKPVAWLPSLEFADSSGPVIQIMDETAGEVVKITRAAGGRYSPGVFAADHVYSIRVLNPDTGEQWSSHGNLRPASQPGASTLRVELR